MVSFQTETSKDVMHILSIYLAQSADCTLVAPADGFTERMKLAIAESLQTKEVPSAEQADIILLNQCWKSRNWHDVEELLSSTFIKQYSQKILTISHDDTATVFLPGLYTSLTPKNLWTSWSLPCGYKGQYTKLSDSSSCVTHRRDNPKWLFSLRGTDVSNPVRMKLGMMYGGVSDETSFTIVNKQFHSHDASDRSIYIDELLDSHFALAPRGWSPSTYRLFEAMQLGVCPVIISDDWQPIPGISWGSCSVRIAERDIDGMADTLRELKPRSRELGLAARQIWLDHFSDGNRERHMLESLTELHNHCIQDRSIKMLEVLWKSRVFREAHGWTIKRRIWRKLANLC